MLIGLSSLSTINAFGEARFFSKPDEPDHRQQLRESVADFTSREATLSATRTGLETDAGFSHLHYKTMADLGWTSVLVREAGRRAPLRPRSIWATTRFR